VSQFSAYTESSILATMIAAISTSISTTEGSATRNTLSPVAVEMAEGYVNLDNVIALFYPQTTYGIYLDNWTALRGMTRKPGTVATGIVTFTGTATTAIPTGTQVQTSGGLVFATTEEVTIASTAIDATIQSEAVGTSYNVPTGSIASLPSAVSGVSSVTNASATTGGTDIETDAALLARFLESARNPSTSGNLSDYYNWALSVPGVGDAKILPLWNGSGTVKVVLIDTDKIPVTNTIVTAVHAYIESVRPIGATVTYEAAAGLSIAISATLTLASGYTLVGIQSAVEAAITAYLKGIAFTNNLSTTQDYVSYAKIGDAILGVTGVMDYSGLTVNTGTANITVPVEDVAILGVVSLS